MKFKKAFRSSLSRTIKKKTSILVRTSGQIDDSKIANKLLKKMLILSLLPRKFINDPTWLYKASKLKIPKILYQNPKLGCF